MDTSLRDVNIFSYDWLRENLLVKAELKFQCIPWIFWFCSIAFHIWKQRNAEVINSMPNSNVGTCTQIVNWTREVSQTFSEFLFLKLIETQSLLLGLYPLQIGSK